VASPIKLPDNPHENMMLGVKRKAEGDSRVKGAPPGFE
jgi:hypothetical protein